MKPNPTTHNPDPKYLRRLLKKAGMTQGQAAKALGVTTRSMRCWLASPDAVTSREAPYIAQFALEALAAAPRG